MEINTDRSELDANGKLNENENYKAAEDVPEVRPEKMDKKERISLSPDQHSGKCERTYQPGKGLHRYSGALKNMIPVRREARESGIVGVDTAGLFSVMSFSWVAKLIYLARRKQITLEDIPEISPYDACNYNVDRLEHLWEDELARQGPEKASLFKVVWKFSRTRIFAAGLSFAISTLLGSWGSSVVMRRLLEYVQSEDGIHYEGLMWASLLPIAELGRISFFNLAWALSYRTALRIRSACSMLLYKKIIRLNNSGDKSIGKVVNIFTNDSQRIFELVLNLPTLVGGPIMTLYAMFYAVWFFGPIALCGIVIFFVFYPFQYIMSRVIKHLQAKAMQFCDVRVKLMNEILDCMEIIKMYAWEEWFSRKLKNSRNKEQEFIFKTSYWLTSNRLTARIISSISVIMSFIAYISIGNNLTAAQAFSYLTLLGGRFGYSLILFQFAIETIIPGRISLERVESILVSKSGDFAVSKPTSESQSIAISQGTFTYDTFDNPSEEMSQENDNERKDELENSGEDNEREKLNTPTVNPKQFHVLIDINFGVTKGKLVGICGHVGSGKSSLLLAALGQLRVLEGKVMRDGSVAYVSQQAWIINATLRENILFGTPYDHERYHKAIHASSLIQDIGMMPAGDQTEIGAKGVNLSGGQKQRVALARALYADRDIYFLDDPLSAVDSRVGSDIFDNYILKALSEKTVLFVTHQIQYLNRCEDIFMMSDGRIVEHGTHDELMKLGNEYAMMVSAISAKNTDEKTTSKKKSTEVLTELNEDDFSSKENRRAIVSASSGTKKENVIKKDTSGAVLTVPEVLQHGTIKAHTYHAYITAAGGYFISFFIIIIFMITNGSTVFSSWWLALWIKAGGGNTTVLRNNETVISNNMNDNPDFWYYRSIYGGSIVIILLSVYLQTLLSMKASTKASTKLHNDLFEKIISSPMRFFDTTPTGRIQHLFSKDMDEVDYRVPTSILNSIHYSLVLLFAIIAISSVFPWLILLMFAIGVGYYFFSSLYRTGVRDLGRLENNSRGPMISIVTATVQGLSTIHAFEKEADFLRKFTDIFNANSKCLFHSQGALRWLAVRVDILVLIIICSTSFLVIALRDQVPPALAGLALSYAANLLGVLQYTTRILLEAEVRFISVERINHYIRTLIGEGGTSQSTVEPPTAWPVTAEIKFKNVSMAYGDNAPLILKNVSFSVNAGEKIGIVGRTGSGKSSLTVALFRLVELAEGKIEIDDVDISKISLKQLRTKISIIPQDPILFSGSIRSNLDPFKLHTDAELWDALEKTKLKSRVQSIAGQLEASVGFGGDSLSIGERQLFCLTRALLRDTKILILDEATAAVDTETEIAVQNMIQEEFSECTVLTIAHRLQTVLPLDRILVMDDGKILEFDTPSNLLADNNSEFSKMLATAEKAVNK